MESQKRSSNYRKSTRNQNKMAYTEIYVELDSNGCPEILHSIEIDGGTGIQILSQTYVDDGSIGLIYQRWREDIENQDKIHRIDRDISDSFFELKYKRHGRIDQ